MPPTKIITVTLDLELAAVLDEYRAINCPEMTLSGTVRELLAVALRGGVDAAGQHALSQNVRQEITRETRKWAQARLREFLADLIEESKRIG